MNTPTTQAHVELGLDLAEVAFRGLCRTGVVIDGRSVAGLKARDYRLPEISGILLATPTSPDLVDAIWAHLVELVRADAAWQVAVIGLASPSLRRLAARICATTALDAADVNSEILCGFIETLHVVDLSERAGLFRRLRAGANAAGMRLVRADRIVQSVRERLAISTAPPHPVHHPDVVLARAVAACVITPGEADLIGATRLEGVPVAVMATAAGVASDAVLSRRWRAERRLVAWILNSDVSRTQPVARTAQSCR